LRSVRGPAGFRTAPTTNRASPANYTLDTLAPVASHLSDSRRQDRRLDLPLRQGVVSSLQLPRVGHHDGTRPRYRSQCLIRAALLPVRSLHTACSRRSPVGQPNRAMISSATSFADRFSVSTSRSSIFVASISRLSCCVRASSHSRSV